MRDITVDYLIGSVAQIVRILWKVRSQGHLHPEVDIYHLVYDVSLIDFNSVMLFGLGTWLMALIFDGEGCRLYYVT